MINYAKKAKNVDMWRLKSALWKILCEQETVGPFSKPKVFDLSCTA